jgi:peroxiredoxin
MKNLLVLISIFLLGHFSTSTFAAEIVFKGKVEGFENKTIKLGIYSDYLTNSKVWIESQVIKEGTFSFTTESENIRQFILKIEDKETTLFAEPGEVYVLKLSYDEEKNRGQSFNKYLNLAFPYPKLEEVNQQIKKFNSAYQNFMAENYRYIMIKKGGKAIETFIADQTKAYENQQNKFVKDYVSYALANLEDINGASKERLIKQYLENKPILFYNKEYISFFTQLFGSDFEQDALKKESQPLLKALMMEEDLKKSLKEVEKLKGFKSQEMAEFYLLHGLFETYHKRIINQNSSKKLIANLTESGSSKEIKELATNILENLEQLGVNQKAPAFTLKNTVGKEMSLSDFKGKIVYLNFWSTTSIPSLRELKVIEKLHQEYGEKVNFVSINVDKPKDNLEIKEKYNFKWSFLHYGNDYDLREKYQVTTLPTYFLINENGDLMRAFAENPIEADRTFHDMFNR